MGFARLRAFAATLPGATRDIETAGALPLAAAKTLIGRSHALVAAKLTKKARETALGSSR